MDGIEKINPVYPGWRINPKDEKHQQKKRQDEKNDQRPDHDEQTKDDGKPHVDDYA